MRALLLCLLASCLAIPCATIAGEPPPYGDNSTAGAFAEVNGVRLYYEIYGEGQPVLLIHGGGGSIVAMTPQIEALSGDYRVIAADSRGHGKSGLETERLTYRQIADDLAALLDTLEVEQAYIFGWSDGGIVGLLLAIRHPEEVAKLAAMAANLRPDASALHEWVRPELLKWAEMVDGQIAAGDDSQDWHRQRLQFDMILTQPHISHAQLQSIQAPVLVMNADMDAIRNSHALEIFENIRNAQLAILPGMTHMAPSQNPEEINALLRRFFDRPFERPDSRDIIE